MGEVKLEQKKQKRLKIVSKIISILAKIGKIMSIIGIVFLSIITLVLPFLLKNIKVENNKITAFGDSITYERNENEIIIKQNDDVVKLTEDEEIKAFNFIFEKIEKKGMNKINIFLEFIFIVGIIMLVMTSIILHNLSKLFKNISTENTPFTLENVNYIKQMVYFLIAALIVPIISRTIGELIIGEEVNILFETSDLTKILFLLAMSYVFEYGYNIQQDSKGIIYGDIKE